MHDVIKCHAMVLETYLIKNLIYTTNYRNALKLYIINALKNIKTKQQFY